MKRLLVTGSRDRTVVLWDVAARRATTTLRGHPDEVGGVLFSPDGRVLIASAGRATRLWDVATGEELASLEGEDVLACDPAGRTLASAVGPTVRLLDVAGRE